MPLNEEDIILEGSLRRCKRHKIFKTKWVEHYFVLHCRDRARKLYAIDEYKTSRKNHLKKRFNLDYVFRVESNLTFNDPTISCSAGGHHNDALNWIFAIGFSFQNVIKDLYLVAKNDVEMSLWVNEICKLCKLHRQNDDIAVQEGDISQAGESSISGMSMSSQSLDMSIIEQQQYSENPCQDVTPSESEDRMGVFYFGGIGATRAHHSSIRKKSSVPSEFGTSHSSMPSTPFDELKDLFILNIDLYSHNGAPNNQSYHQQSKSNPDQKSYLRMHQFKSVSSQQSLPQHSNPNYNNLPDTRSETSSMYSSRRTEDDSASFTSGPPVPPPRTRHTLNRFIKNGVAGRLHMIPASTSMSQVKADADDSSGETLKLDTPETYPESVTSSEGVSNNERNPRTLIRRAPPPVDRSNKPKNLRGEEGGKRYRNIGRNSSVDDSHRSYAHTFAKPTNYQMPDPSKRKNLDYFEPTQLVDNSSSSTVANSTRSPTPSDIEYISVDVDRTLAFKQMRRSGPGADYSI